jgi:hypothetical protein
LKPPVISTLDHHRKDVVTPHRLSPPIIAVALALCLSACGGSDGSSDAGKNAKKYEGTKKDVAQVVDDLESAAHAGDGKKICNEIFDPVLQKSVNKASGDCESAVVKPLKNTTFTVDSVKVTGGNAQAQVSQSTGGQATFYLRNTGDTWRMTGATPKIKQAVPPPKQPKKGE